MTDIDTRFAAQQSEIDALRAELAALHPTTPSSTSAAEVDAHPPSMGRRTALRTAAGLAAGAVAGGAAAALTATPAAATDGNPLVLGRPQDSTGSTGIYVSGPNRPYGLGITDNGLSGFRTQAAIAGHARNQAFSAGIHGEHTGTTVGYGVFGTSESSTGGYFRSTNGNGVTVAALGASSTGVAITATNHLLLGTNDPASPATQPGLHLPGSIRAQKASDPQRTRLWACVAQGSPGQWRVLAGPDSAGSLHPLDPPVRLYDSRPGTNPPNEPKSPIPAGGTRTIIFDPNLPRDATVLVLNILLVNASSGDGNLTIWGVDRAKPATNTMVWGGDAGRFCSLALVTLTPGRGLQVQVNASRRTDLVLDCVGYHR